MAKFKIDNPDLSGEERTYLESDYSSGASLTVRNNDGFGTSDFTAFAIAGEVGQEQTESSQVASVTGKATITLNAAYNFTHPKSTPIYRSRWNQIAVERASASGGSFAAITNSPFNIEWDNADKTTLIVDDAASSGNVWRWRFYNSVDDEYSSYSDELPVSGLGRLQVGFLIGQVKRNPLVQQVPDETILDYFNDYQDLIYEKMPNAWWFTKKGTSVSTAASDYDYSISSNWSDYVSMKYLLYEYISGDVDITYPLSWVPLVEFYNLKSDANQSDDDYVKQWTLLPADSSSAKGYIGLHPTPKTTNSNIIPVFNFEPSALDSFGDTAVIPHSKGYVDYAQYRIFDDILNDEANATKFNARVAASITALRKRAKRQTGQPELFRFRGHRGFSRQFGEQTRASSSDIRENYW